MYKNQTLSIILPALNEDQSISNFIVELKKLNIFDEIICVDNNSTDNTKNEIIKNNVTYLFEDKKGYGAAVKKGLNHAKTDLLMISEPEGSFVAKDSLILLSKLDENDAVFTSRTFNKHMIFYLKYGNRLYAKFLSLLFNGPKLSDVGSSFRVFKRKNFDFFKDTLKYNGPEFQLELTINLFRQKLKITEIKIEHKPRIGKSHYTGNFFDSLMVVFQFTKVVFLKLFRFE
jgi:glycosyltransferase involved in cell wall biosynthesis